MPADRVVNSNRSPRCLAIEAQLFDYVDSTLSEQQMQALDAHLSECGSCRIEVEQIKRAESALLAAPLTVPQPGDLYAGFADKLAARQSKTPAFRLRYLAPTFALGIIALVLLWPSHPNSTDRSLRPPSALTFNIPSAKFATAEKQSVGSERSVALSNFGFDSGPTRIPALLKSEAASVTNRKRAGKRLSDLALNLAGERHVGRRLAVKSVVRSNVNGVMLADNLLQLREIEGTIAQNRYGYALDGERTENLNGNVDLMYLTPGSAPTAELGKKTRGYSTPITDQTSQAGFALVVQDDVRGFTAEAHNADSSSTPRPTVGAADDGVKIEVQLDAGDSSS